MAVYEAVLSWFALSNFFLPRCNKTFSRTSFTGTSIKVMKHVVERIENVKTNTLLQIFTIYLRYLLGGAFVIAAIVMGKLSNVPMAMANNAQPIGELAPLQQFFRVIIESGLYWNFIGWMQIIVGVLMMTQRMAKLGALMFFGMILNIFIITVSYGFTGTPVVTGLMLLGAIYLLVWDVSSLQYMVLTPSAMNLPKRRAEKMIDSKYWMILGILMLISVTVGSLSKWSFMIVLLMPVAEGLIGLIIYLALLNKQNVGALKPMSTEVEKP